MPMSARVFVAAVLFSMCSLSQAASAPAPVAILDVATAGRFANLALKCLHREYPNKIAHTLASDADVHPPRELYPAFYGCYDWHSAVHGHWLLVRLARQFPGRAFGTEVEVRPVKTFVAPPVQAQG